MGTCKPSTIEENCEITKKEYTLQYASYNKHDIESEDCREHQMKAQNSNFTSGKLGCGWALIYEEDQQQKPIKFHKEDPSIIKKRGIEEKGENNLIEGQRREGVISGTHEMPCFHKNLSRETCDSPQSQSGNCRPEKKPLNPSLPSPTKDETRRNHVSQYLSRNQVEFGSRNEATPCESDYYEQEPVTYVIPSGDIQYFIPQLANPSKSSILMRRKDTQLTSNGSSKRF